MASLTWMRCLVWWIFLCSSLQDQATDGSKTISDLKILNSTKKHYNCTCTNKKGQVYNLTKLEKHGKLPRFTAVARDGYNFSYNPCLPFTLGTFGDCSASQDVAICMWTKSSFQNIGTQSSFSCFVDNNPPYLLYRSDTFRYSPSKIVLICDWQKETVKSASFTVITDKDNWTLSLTHRCACPDGCPETPAITAATEQPASRHSGTSGTNGPENPKDIWFPVCISAASVVFVIVALFVIFRLIDRRNPPQEIRPLLEDRGNQIDPRSSVAGGTENNEEFVTPPESMTSTTCFFTPPVSMTSTTSLSKIAVPDEAEKSL